MILTLPPITQPIAGPDGKCTVPWYQLFARMVASQPNVGCVVGTVAFNTAGIGTASTVAIGTLPTGCLHYKTIIRVSAQFNAGTTNVLTVGTAADASHYIADLDWVNLAGAVTDLERNLGDIYTADTPVYVKYTQTGAAATTGAADIILIYTVGR